MLAISRALFVLCDLIRKLLLRPRIRLEIPRSVRVSYSPVIRDYFPLNIFLLFLFYLCLLFLLLPLLLSIPPKNKESRPSTPH